MKPGWQIKTLGEVCIIRHGANQRTVETPDGEYPIYGSGGAIGWAKDFRCPAQTVLIGRKGTLNNPILVTTPCWNIDTAYGLIPQEKLLPKYLFYFCCNTDFTTLDATSGRPSTKATSLSKIPIPLPPSEERNPLAEQKRIVGILDSAFEKIDAVKRNAEQNLANAKELFQRVLDEEMTPKEGWTRNTLGKLCSKIGSGATPKGGRSGYLTEGINLIRSLNVHYNKFSYKDLAHISSEQAKALDGVTILENDILLNITGASIARCCLVPTDVIPARVNQHVSILRLNNSLVLHNFLVFFLIAPLSQKKLLTTGEEAGSTRQALTKTDLSKFIIDFPNIQQQGKIIAKLNDCASKCEAEQEHTANTVKYCAELKQQILAKAFNGEL